MAKNKKNNKKGNVNNVGPKFKASDGVSSNTGLRASESERESSDSSPRISVVDNPTRSDNQGLDGHTMVTRAHNSELTMVPFNPAFGGSGTVASAEAGDGRSTSSATTAHSQSDRSSNLENLAVPADQHFRASGSAEAGQGSLVGINQRSLPAVSTPSGNSSTDHEGSTTGHFVALISALGIP